MAAGPLSLLGESIAQGAREYSNYRNTERVHARDREEMLADESRREGMLTARTEGERKYQDTRIKSERDYEAQLYHDRRFDALKTGLVQSGLLKPEDIDKPDVVQAALAKTGLDYQRKAEELASYKAMLPKIIEAVGTVEGGDAVMRMKPEEVEAARSIVEGAYKKLGLKVDEERNRKELNSKTAAALISVELENTRKLQGDLSDIENGVVSQAERMQAFREAAGKMGYANEAQIPASDRGAIQADAEKIIKDNRLVRGYQLQQSLRETQKRFDNIADNVRAGVYGYLKDATPPPAATAPKAPAPKVVTPDDEAAALRALQGGTLTTPPARGQPPGAVPVALGVQPPGAGAPPARGTRLPVPDYGRPFSDEVMSDPKRTLGDVALGFGRDAAYNAIVGLDQGLTTAVDRLGRNRRRAVPGAADDVSTQLQTLQSQLKTVDPLSPAGQQIQTKIRSLQTQLSQPTALGVD